MSSTTPITADMNEAATLLGLDLSDSRSISQGRPKKAYRHADYGDCADSAVLLSPFGIYHHIDYGDWVHHGTVRNPYFGCWRQVRPIEHEPSVELRLDGFDHKPPALFDIALARQIFDERQHFLNVFWYWGELALQKMGADPKVFMNAVPHFYGALQLTTVTIPHESFKPYFANKPLLAKKYEIVARHRVHQDYELSAKWRGLEPVYAEARLRSPDGTIAAVGQVWLKDGEPIDQPPCGDVIPPSEEDRY